MRKIKLSLCLIFAFLYCFHAEAQIQIQKSESPVVIGKCKNGAYTQAQLSYMVQSDKDTLYNFSFLNAKYTTIDEYQDLLFSGENNTLNDFYGILKSVFKDENKKNKEYQVEFKLGNTQVVVSTYRTMGVTSVLLTTGKGYCYLTEKQVKKIFNRED